MPNLTTLARKPLTSDSVPDTLTVHSVPSIPDNQSDSLTGDSVLDTLTIHSGPLVVGLDWERDGWRVSYGQGVGVKMTRAALLNEPFTAAALVIVEQAHMKERNAYSVAQVYTAAELAILACRDKVKLFPGMPGQLAKAAREVGNISGEVNEYGTPLPDKEKDAETMALYAAKSPQRVCTWKPLRLAGEDPSRRLWPARDALRDDLREALNPLRSAWNAKPTAGNLRTRPDGEFIGIRFILNAIGLSSSYRPNMARSQLTHHGMRHYKGGRDGGERSQYMRNLRHFMQLLRDHTLTDDSVPDALTRHSVGS